MGFSTLQIDALTEMVNIAIGKSADSLNRLLGQKILLEVPVLQEITKNELPQKMAINDSSLYASVDMAFKGDINGLSQLIFTQDCADKLTALIFADIIDEIPAEEARSGAINETGNIILNCLLGTVSNILNIRLQYEIPRYIEQPPSIITDEISPASEKIVFAETGFKIPQNKIQGSFMLFLELNSFETLSNLLEKYLHRFQ